MPHTRKEILQIGREIANRIFHKKKEETKTINGWIARDHNGALCFYSKKPFKQGHMWISLGRLNHYLNYLSFKELPSVKWEDEEPTPCTITIKIEK